MSTTVSDLRQDTTLYARWFVRGTSTFYNNHSDTDTTTVSKGSNGWQYVPVNGSAKYVYTPAKKDGYTCIGWNTDRNVTTGSFDIKFSDLIRQSDGDYENNFYAIWEKNVYTVSFDPHANLSDADQLNLAADLTTLRYEELSDIESTGITLNYPTADGFWVYKFEAYDEDTGARIQDGGSRNTNSTQYTLTGNFFNYHVHWRVRFYWEKLYRFIYDANLPEGASITNGDLPNDKLLKLDATRGLRTLHSGTGPKTATYADGKTASFKGWSLSNDNNIDTIVDEYITDEQFGGSYSQIGTGRAGNSVEEKRFNRTLYAVWEDNVSIYYDANGGTIGINHDETKVVNSSDSAGFTDYQLLAGSNISRENHTFRCWNTERDGSGTDYELHQAVTTAEDVHLYAQWDYNSTYYVVFDKNMPHENMTVNYIPESHTLSTNAVPTDWTIRTGYNPSPEIFENVYVAEDNYTYENQRTYVFKGWTLDQAYAPDALVDMDVLADDPTNIVNSEKVVTKAQQSQFIKDENGDCYITAHAYWQESVCVTLHGNGCTIANTGQKTVKQWSNSGKNIYATSFSTYSTTRDDYDFWGYNTKPDGTGTWYSTRAIWNTLLSRGMVTDETPHHILYSGANDPGSQDMYFYGFNNDDNHLYYQWHFTEEYRIEFDMNVPEGTVLKSTPTSERTGSEHNRNLFDADGYWHFSTMTPFCYEPEAYGRTNVQTYCFMGWSLSPTDPDQVDVVYEVPSGSEDASEIPDEGIEVSNKVHISKFHNQPLDDEGKLTVTVHAVWKKRAVVTFHGNGGATSAGKDISYSMPTSIFDADINSFPSTPGFHKACNLLLGYNTKANGTGIWYCSSRQWANVKKYHPEVTDETEHLIYGSSSGGSSAVSGSGGGIIFEGKNNEGSPNNLYAQWHEYENYRIEFDMNKPVDDAVISPVISPRLANESSSNPFKAVNGSEEKYWTFSTLTPYCYQYGKYGRAADKKVQTYQFMGWSLQPYTPDQVNSSTVVSTFSYELTDGQENLEEPDETIEISNRIPQSFFEEAEDVVTIDDKDYLSVKVYAVWKERAVLRLVVNDGSASADELVHYIMPGSIFSADLNYGVGDTFLGNAPKGCTFIGFNTKRDGTGTYYLRKNNSGSYSELTQYLHSGWEDKMVDCTSGVTFVSANNAEKDGAETPNVLYAQWVRNYTLTYHLNLIDGSYDAHFGESGKDYRCSVNYDMMDWTETLEDGTSSTTEVYPYHNLRDMLPSIKKQEENDKNYYFMGWSWEEINGPVDSYDTSKLVDRAEFNDLYEADSSKWHFKAPTGNETKYHGDIYAVWSAQPYKLIFDKNARQSDSDITKPKESSITSFPTDRELSYHDMVSGYTFDEIIPTATGYSFATDERWNTSYTRKSNSTTVTGKIKNGNTFSLYTFRNAQDSTITAIANWVPDEYTVHYGWEKYTTTNTPTDIEKDKKVESYNYESTVRIADRVTPPTYENAHVHFTGWRLVGSDWKKFAASDAVYAADGTTDIRTLTAGQTFPMPTQDLYFLAVYESDTLTVTYDPGDGTGDIFTENPVYNSSHTVKTFTDDSLNFTAPSDKKFSSWALTINGASSTKYTTAPGETIEHLTDNIVYTAQYTDILYTVKYQLEDGSADPNVDLASLLGTRNSAYVLPPDSAAVKAGSSVTVEPLLSVDGYEFTGWKLDGTTYAAGASIEMQSGGVTLTGKFTPIDYKLHYITNRKAADSDSVDDTEVGEPETFQRKDLQKDDTGEYYTLDTTRTPEVPSGYTFTGWTTTRSGSGSTSPKVYFVSDTNGYNVYGQWRNWNYLVNYVTAHGTAPDSQTFTLGQVMTGEARISQTIPTESGYDFRSWIITNGGSKTFEKDKLNNDDENVIPRTLFVESASNENGVATANAKWNKLYRLTFDLNGGKYNSGSNDSMESVNFSFADDITGAKMSDIGATLPTDLAKTDGSTFDKWQLEIRNGSGDVTKALTFNADNVPLNEFVLIDGLFTATLKALWNAPEAHEVTYRLTSDSALKDTALPSEASHVKDEKFNVAAPRTATGYTFSGWYQVDRESDITVSTEQIRDQREFTMPDNDVTFWGRFTANSYPVEYYDSNGTTQLTAFQKPFTTEITVGLDGNGAKITPSKDGYQFIRWERMTGSATAGSDGNDIPATVDADAAQTFRMPAGTVKYRAVYEKLFTLVYNANGGSAPIPDPHDFAVEESQSSTQPFDYTQSKLPTREDYRFIGWNTASDGTSRQESVAVAYDSDGYSLDNATKRFIVPVYAVWEASYTVTYTVENAPAGYVIPEPVTFRQFAGDKFDVKQVPDVTGYDFDGWHYNDNGTDRIYAESESFTMPAANVTFSGSFTPWKYTLYFKDSLSDADYGTQTVTYEAFAANGSGIKIERNDPTKDNYTFKGWAKSKSAETAEYQKGDSVTGYDETRTATVYALWEQKYRVTYELRLLGGNNDPQASEYESDIPVDDTLYPPGEKVSVKEKLSVDGYEFHGWQKDGEDVTEFDMPSNNVVLIGWFTKDSGGDEIVHITYRSGIPKNAEDYSPDMNDPYDVSVTKGQPHTIIAHDSDILKYVRDTETYEFTGWKMSSTPSSGSGSSSMPGSGSNEDELLADGATIKSVETSITLTAQWKKLSGTSDPKTYKLTYDGNGATGGKVPTDDTAYKGGEKVLVAAQGTMVRAGCTFKEWNTKKDGSGTGYRGGKDVITMPSDNVTLYAIWVDEKGKIVSSPGTGESNVPIAIAFSMAILSALAIAVLLSRMRRKALQE